MLYLLSIFWCLSSFFLRNLVSLFKLPPKFILRNSYPLLHFLTQLYKMSKTPTQVKKRSKFNTLKSIATQIFFILVLMLWFSKERGVNKFW